MNEAVAVLPGWLFVRLFALGALTATSSGRKAPVAGGTPCG